MSRLSILANRLGLSGGIGGGGDEPKEQPKKQLSYDQINQWSDFVELNPNIRGMDEMWEAFSKKFPNSGIDRNVLTNDLDRVIKVVQDRAAAWGEKSPGGLTTGMAFPKVQFEDTPYGRMNSFGQTQVPMPSPKVTYPEKLIQQKIPDDVTDVWYDTAKGLYAYEDPREGVVKFASKQAANDPKIIEIIKRNMESKQQ